MRVALDPYMLRHVPLTDLPAVVRDLGYDAIELSPRDDCIPFFRHPRIGSVGHRRLPCGARPRPAWRSSPSCRSSAGPGRTRPSARPRCATGSGPSRSRSSSAAAHELRVQRAARGRRRPARRSSGARWRSSCRSSSGRASTSPSRRIPDDFVEDGNAAVDLIRGIDSPRVSYLYCAPHTFHLGGRHRGHAAPRGCARDPGPPRRHARSPGLERPALHRQPARLAGPRPPASRHRPGRGRLRGALQRPARDRLRRHPHHLRLRVGGARCTIPPASIGPPSTSCVARHLA